MKSFEVIKEAVQDKGVKQIASDMKISTSLLYKWSQESQGEGAAGADNPLDRVKKLYDITGNRELLEWLCGEAGGFFTENPLVASETNEHPLKITQKILDDFSKLLAAVSESLENDDKIDEKETMEIRSLWDKLKVSTESFVVSCENGTYQ